MTEVTSRILKRLFARFSAEDLAIREETIVELPGIQWHPKQPPTLGGVEFTLALPKDPFLTINHDTAQVFNLFVDYQVSFGRRTRAAVRTEARTMSEDVKKLVDLIRSDD